METAGHSHTLCVCAEIINKEEFAHKNDSNYRGDNTTMKIATEDTVRLKADSALAPPHFVPWYLITLAPAAVRLSVSTMTEAASAVLASRSSGQALK